MTQKMLLLKILKENGPTGLNSYDADYKYHVKQAPTRIYELRAMGYEITAHTNPNKSVNWVLNREEKKRPVYIFDENGMSRMVT